MDCLSKIRIRIYLESNWKNCFFFWDKEKEKGRNIKNCTYALRKKRKRMRKRMEKEEEYNFSFSEIMTSFVMISTFFFFFLNIFNTRWIITYPDTLHSILMFGSQIDRIHQQNFKLLFVWSSNNKSIAESDWT